MGNKLIEFVKKEAVLCIVTVLAAVSCFFVPPSMDYIGYIDFRTLALLLSLMAVMSGFSRCGVFTYFAKLLLNKAKDMRSVGAVLILLCFFTSMAVTNDVALITFVPFAIEVLTRAKKHDEILFVVVMQTVAANLGSMLTPIGNPQNLYLYSLSGMSAGELISTMLPYTAVSLVLVCTALLFIKRSGAECDSGVGNMDKKGAVLYAVLFFVCMLTVSGAVHYGIVLAAVCITILIVDRKTLLNVDYSLLFTFVGFFIFIGNIKNISAVNSWLMSVISGNEFMAAVASSQVISNVPAAVLLSGFTDNYRAILIGANIGGLGTLIASMASLISYKYFANVMSDKKSRYIFVFTAVNILFLIALIGVYIICE